MHEQHSPLPWRADDVLVRSTHERSQYGPVDKCIATCWPMCSSGIAVANAEFIVRACNSHADLLAECKAAAEWLRSFRSPMMSTPEEDALVDGAHDVAGRLETAIAKAEGR